MHVSVLLTPALLPLDKEDSEILTKSVLCKAGETIAGLGVKGCHLKGVMLRLQGHVWWSQSLHSWMKNGERRKNMGLS